ncbi:MAG: hypothetical protein GX856_00535 [Gammaproteobacteria bacterium]|jgi:hypothetical protein|nr:hypothetical protein [Gammaproteobacteria bacterium]
MITPFNIYIVMQLDTIGNTLTGMATAAILVTAAMGIVATVMASADPEEWTIPRYKASAQRNLERAPVVWGWTVRLAVFAACPLTVLATVLPDSKTAAAMIVLPAIVNNESVQQESREIYELAKGALRELATSDEVPAK